MSINKNQFIRYRVLNDCFRDFNRKYYFDDLQNKCVEALRNYGNSTTSISSKTTYNDMDAMRSIYGVEIEGYSGDLGKYYRYTDENTNINIQPISPEERSSILSAIDQLSRFSGIPQFGWVDDFKVHLKELGMDFSRDGNRSLISFDESPFYTGSQHISPLYEAILNQCVLDLTYQPFEKEAMKIILSPYFLKQYNKRWFLVGYTHGLKQSISIYPLDRIISFEEKNKTLFSPTEIDFTEYFDDMIGVTKRGDKQELETVRLRISKQRYKYIATKPLHSSQTELKAKNSDGEILQDLPYQDIELTVYINKELEAMILSFGKDIEVLEPAHLRDCVENQIQCLCKCYKLDCK